MTSSNRVSWKRALLIGGAVTCVNAGAAAAQGANDATPSTPLRDAAISVGEVIVTAQRREERLRDVPITITAKSAEQLERSGVTNIKDLNTVAPGVTMVFSSGFLQPTVRGVSGQATGAGSNAPVAIYLDGVYQTDQHTNRFQFADLDRIEVDKGPQGTLYGRNATGGAIAVFTKNPTFTPTGNFEVGYGTFKDVLAKGFVAGPIVADKLAGSLSAYYEKRDSYNRDIVSGSRPPGLDDKMVRGKLLFTPAEGVKFTLTLTHEHRTMDNSHFAINGNTVAAQDPTAIIVTTPHKVALDSPARDIVNHTAATLRSDFDLPLGTLTSITATQYARIRDLADIDSAYNPNQVVAGGNIFDVIVKDRSFSEDLSFASRKWGGLGFVAGASYFHDNNRFAPNRGFTKSGQIPTLILADNEPNKAYAGFLEATYELTDRLVVIGGVRYTHETERDSGTLIIPGGFVLPYPGNVKNTKFDKATFRASARYKLTDDTNAYFTFSQGFKSGGIGGTAFTSATIVPFEPETIDAYEVGVKSNPSPRLSVNASAFYYNYSNLQVLTLQNLAIGVTLNAASSRIYGFDLDATARLTDEFTLTTGLELLHAKYESYPNAAVLTPIFRNGLPAGNGNVIINADGNRMPLAPTITASLVADYKKDFSAGTLQLNATGYYSDKIYFDSVERLHQGAYATLNAQASWRPAGSQFTFVLWGRNLTDTKYLSSAFESTVADFGAYDPPRTFGAAIRYAF
jgi:iron complex outermembrane receptor protein